MKPKNVFFTLFLVIAVLAIVISRVRHDRGKELFDRHPKHLEYTHHALCRMDCRHISKNDINEIMEKGIINLNKSNRNASPCPVYALQGFTDDGKDLRVIFA
ncbi:MAG: DUF4258 domain-containing protein, partial [Flavisolibacter sp.]